MAISAVTASATTAGQTNSANFTISSPAGTQAGDVLVCVVAERPATDSVTGIAASGGGSPFTKITFTQTASNSSVSVWYRVVQAGDPTTWTISISATAEAVMMAYRGVDNTTPIDASGSAGGGSASPGTFNAVTTVTAGAWYIGAASLNNAGTVLNTLSSGSPTPQVRGNAGNGGATNGRAAAALIDVAETSAGSTGTFVYTLTATAVSWASYSFALRPAATGTTYTQSLAATLQPSADVTPLHTTPPVAQTFTTSGTWVCPGGITSVTVEAWGGGGAGGAASTTADGGGGGAGGQYAKALVSVTPGTSYTVTVAGVTAGGSGTGASGADSTFGSSTVVAKGGAGGTANNGAGGTGSVTGGVGDTVFAGGNGAAGSGSSGGGGGGAGSSGAGGNAAGTTAGTGTATGGGSGGAGQVNAANAAGLAGSTCGGGGGGGTKSGGGTKNGGSGAAGQIVVSWDEPLPTFQIRQEINILDGALGATLNPSALVQVDTTRYSGYVTYYFEIVGKVSAGTATVSLRRKGTTTDDATLSLSGTSYARSRSSFFIAPAGQTEYFVAVAGGTSPSVLDARIIVLQNTASSALTATQTQIEIGDNETKSNGTIAALTSPKYWHYDSSVWDGATQSFSAEVTYQKTDTSFTNTSSFTSSGSWTAPAGVTSVSVEAWGGGGAGGDSGTTVGGGGGGGGAYAAGTIAVTPGVAYAYTVGSGGVGASNADGGAGAASSWDGGTQVSAAGGAGGRTGIGGSGAGGAGGSGSVGTTVFSGGAGATSTLTVGGGGGSGAGSTGAGTAASGATAGTAVSQNGGAGGTGGASNGVGSAGSVYGGAGGGNGPSNSSHGPGAGGAAGLIRVSYNAPALTVTVKVEEDDGSFGNWGVSNSWAVVNALDTGTPTRARVSFTPTNGKNYRISAFVSSGANYTVYNAKIIVDQSDATAVTKLEPQYLLLNTTDAGTGLQQMLSLWDSSEWVNTTNVYTYAQDATNAADSSKLQDVDNANADVTTGSQIPGGANQNRGVAFTMPASGHQMDVNVTNTTGAVNAGRIIAAVTLPAVGVVPLSTRAGRQGANACYRM